MPTWKPPITGDRTETWTRSDDDGYVLGTIYREGNHWVAQSAASGRIGDAENRRAATALLAYDRLTKTAQESTAARQRRGEAEREVAIRTLGFDPEPKDAGYQDRYAGDTGELLSWAREKKTPAEIRAEVDQLLRETKPAKTPRAQIERVLAARKKPHPVRGSRGRITEELARELPRFEFIAHWLTRLTKKKENRGPLGLYVRRYGKRWQIISPVGGGTVTFETADPALLFDYARRGQLGTHIRDAEEFRRSAYQRIGQH